MFKEYEWVDISWALCAIFSGYAKLGIHHNLYVGMDGLIDG